jgi:CubicO group peptidase (beta-lactamase class C family)
VIHGPVEPGFEAVETEFRRNFSERGELGAACAIYHRGQKVVDLRGGCRDHKTGAPWEEDTLVPVFSTTKGMAAMAVAVAHSRGLLNYDEKVATYWPEFAQQGKEDITVAPNKIGLDGFEDAAEKALRDAFYRCLERL